MSDYIFAVADYLATGEGRTIHIMITTPWPRGDEYDEKPSASNDYRGKCSLTDEEKAMNRMLPFAGDYYGSGTLLYKREDFLKYYGAYLPPFLKEDLEEDKIDYNLSFKTMVHQNFS